MPVEDTHPSFQDREAEWKLCADALRGQQAIKEASSYYLPKPSGFAKNPDPAVGKDLYEAYLERAEFPDIFSLTLRGMVGLIHRKEAVVSGLEGTPLEPLHEHATRPGLHPRQTLMSFHASITEQLVAKGRVAVLTDASSKGSDVPWLARYDAETITNWSADGSLFVLDESGLTRSPTDEFTWVETKAFRVLRVRDGKYVGQIYTDFSDLLAEEERILGNPRSPESSGPRVASNYEAYSGVTGPRPAELARSPTAVNGRGVASGLLAGADPYEPKARGGKPLDFVPLVVGGAIRMGLEPETPPLLGVARAALSIYRLSADYRHQLFNSGQETMYVSGVDQKNVPKVVGSGVIIGLGANGEMGYASPTCVGISAHRDAIKDETARAISAGVQLFDQGGSGQSGDALRLRYGAQTATLVTIARQSAAILEGSLRNAGRMVGMSEEAVSKIIVAPNLEFLENLMTPQEAQNLVTVWQSGAISYDTLYDNYVRGGIASGERTADEEQDLIDAETPDVPTLGGRADLGLGNEGGGPAPAGDGTEAGPGSVTNDELLSTFGDFAADAVGQAA